MMFTIRRYNLDDIPQMINHVSNFLTENRGKDYQNHFASIDFAPDKLYEVLKSNVNNIEFFTNLIIADGEVVGGLCAIVAAPIYSNQKIAYDQLLYVTPRYNVVRAVRELIKSYVEWAERRGVHHCRLASSTGFNTKAFGMLCKRSGFIENETGYMRKF